MPTFGKNKKIILLPEEVKFIQDNWETMTNPLLAEALGLRLTRLRYFLAEMGLKRMEMEYWTAEQVAFLKANYKRMGDVEMAEFFEAQWPKNKPWSKKHIEKKRRYLKIKRDEKTLVKIQARNTKAGRFNTENHYWKITPQVKVGVIKFWKHQYGGALFPVIKLEHGFVHYYRWLYIQTHGDISSDDLVVPKKGVPRNELLTIDQLEVIDRAEHAIRNVEIKMQLPEELREIMRLTNKLRKTIKSTQNESRN